MITNHYLIKFPDFFYNDGQHKYVFFYKYVILPSSLDRKFKLKMKVKYEIKKPCASSANNSPVFLSPLILFYDEIQNSCNKKQKNYKAKWPNGHYYRREELTRIYFTTWMPHSEEEHDVRL